MTRITVDVDDALLEAARQVLGTDTKVATINAALEKQALVKKARDITAALDSVDMDFSDSEKAWRYGGGRDLSKLAERAREEVAREREVTKAS
jgi:Arc/MetJ family transcription regulator